MHKAFDKATEHIHKKKGFNAEMLQDEPVKGLSDEINAVLSNAVKKGIVHEVPKAMLESLEKDVFVFSKMKTYMELKEVSSLLLDENKNIKPFSKFSQEVKQIDETYNENYLQAEYNFATGSAQSASNWVKFEKDGDRYNLQYRTAQDNRVRPDHQTLADITLPLTDPFWDHYFPPNGWNCRCTTVQVLKDDYKESSSDEAVVAGENATSKLDKDGKNAAAIFRFNPGKEKVIFPPKHPYYKASKAKKIVDEMANEKFKKDK